jgi:Flp pilus assembly protein TadG
MYPRSQRPSRRGASLVETVLATTVFVTMALGMVDLGVGVFQNHLVSEASRQGARIASVHGSLAPPGWSGGSWGTTAYSGAGDSTDVIPTTIRNTGALVGLDAANVTISVSWPDESNVASPPSYTNVNPGTNRVQVTVSTTWTPILGLIFGNASRTLSATSVMPIAH